MEKRLHKLLTASLVTFAVSNPSFIITMQKEYLHRQSKSCSHLDRIILAKRRCIKIKKTYQKMKRPSYAPPKPPLEGQSKKIHRPHLIKRSRSTPGTQEPTSIVHVYVRGASVAQLEIYPKKTVRRNLLTGSRIIRRSGKKAKRIAGKKASN